MGSTGEGSPYQRQRHQSPLCTVFSEPEEMSGEQNNNTENNVMRRGCNKKNVQFENVMSKNLRRRGRDLEKSMEQNECLSEKGGEKLRESYAKCTSSRSHNSRNLFSLGKPFIIYFLANCVDNFSLIARKHDTHQSSWLING